MISSVPNRAWGRHLVYRLSTALAVVLAMPAVAFSDPGRSVDFNIRSQSLQNALLAFSEQAGVQIILPGDMAGLRLRRELQGPKAIEAALAILIAETGYEYRFTGPNTVVVRRSASPIGPATAAIDTPRAEKRRTVKSLAVRTPEPVIEELVTVGTRNPSRTVTETAVPVDVIGARALRHSGYTQTGELLQALAPSFNFTETTISDGTDIVRPATLRGLGPDQVLVLINGKRRHSQAWVNVQNTIGKGAVGTDMNTIPAGAIKRVEILRDGAAAQYGSDAIAGVVNIVLKDHDLGLTGLASWGQTYEGDGDVFFASSTLGLPLKTSGYFNVTAEYQDRQATNRAEPSSITGDVVMRIGDTDVEATSVMWNSAIPAGSGGEIYAFGGFSDRNGVSGGFYRHAFQAPRSVPQLYPNGFLPLQTTDVSDFSQAVGFRYDNGRSGRYDLSATYGRARFAFGAENTANVSLASAAFYAGGDLVRASPTSGFSGALEFDQLTVNFDGTGEAFLGSTPLHFAYGLEYRNEHYAIEEGDPASYECGFVEGEFAPSILDPDTTAICGFQGFPGYSPDVAGEKSRSSHAVYVDAEIEPEEGWLLAGAVRYENFGSTGNKITGKGSVRYRVSDSLALRGALSTGFRAPALAQRAFTSVITNTSADGLTQTLVAPEGHVIAETFGVDKLRHETNVNYSLGLVWNAPEGMQLTLDAYRIDIDDRIVLGPTLPLPDDINLGAIEAASFFSNAVDTRTYGVDFVACYKIPLDRGEIDLVGSFSWTRTDIVNVNAPDGISSRVFFPVAERINVEKSQPRTRATMHVDYRNEAFGALVRLNYYGNTESAYYTAPGNNLSEDLAVGVYGLDYAETISPGTAAIVDIEISYDINRNLSLALGANNLFNKFPDEVADNSLSRWISEGRKNGAFGNFRYPWVVMPWGIGGGHYYVRLSFGF